jgi:hypothetical protein
VHTHPATSAAPSSTDEETLARVFGKCTWAIMFILARGGQSFARLRFNVGPGGELLIPVEVDYSRPFAASDFGAWQAEYQANVRELKPKAPMSHNVDRWLAPFDKEEHRDGAADDWQDAWFEYVDPLESDTEFKHGYIRDFE